MTARDAWLFAAGFAFSEAIQWWFWFQRRRACDHAERLNERYIATARTEAARAMMMEAAKECERNVPQARIDAWSASPHPGAPVDQTSALVLADRIRALLRHGTLT